MFVRPSLVRQAERGAARKYDKFKKPYPGERESSRNTLFYLNFGGDGNRGKSEFGLRKTLIAGKQGRRQRSAKKTEVGNQMSEVSEKNRGQKSDVGGQRKKQRSEIRCQRSAKKPEVGSQMSEVSEKNRGRKEVGRAGKAARRS
jgi:hypothetical protein